MILPTSKNVWNIEGNYVTNWCDDGKLKIIFLFSRIGELTFIYYYKCICLRITTKFHACRIK